MTFEDAVWIGLGLKAGKDYDMDPLTSREQAEHEDMEHQDDWAEAQHRALLEFYCRSLWLSTQPRTGQFRRTLEHRLELIARHIHKVSRYGVAENQESDYQLDLLLTEWGAGKLIAYFGALAETEGQL